MSAFKLKALGAGPGFVLATRADGRSAHTVTMSVAAFEAHNAEAREVEQVAAQRAKNKQILQDVERYIKERAADRKRREEQQAADEAERKRSAKRAADKSKADAFYNTMLKQLQSQWRPPAVGQALVQAAPVVATESAKPAFSFPIY
ncbi:MAG: hypothetical protein WDO74_37440 [Pseudomonadota bacterium]